MSGSKMFLAGAAATILAGFLAHASMANAQRALAPSPGDPPRYGFGAAPSPTDLSRFFAISPDGRGLPPGRGSYAQGQTIYEEQCAGCHGDKLQGWANGMMMPPELAAMGDGRLVGGRGSLPTPMPVFTVESYWPYATTLWDYIKRAMPQQAPGSLSDDEVYALVAYLLGEANIVPNSVVMDEESLPKVVMPNRDGFVADPRPELELFRTVSPSAGPPPDGRPPMMMPGKMR